MKQEIIGDEIDYRHDVTLGKVIRSIRERRTAVNTMPWVLGRMANHGQGIEDEWWWR